MRAYEIITEGPAVASGEELAHMINKGKPSSVIFKFQWTKEWADAVKKYGWVVLQAQPPAVYGPAEDMLTYIISKNPKDAMAIKTLLESAWAGKIKFGPVYHAQLGRLLGYSAADIASFILSTSTHGVGRVLSTVLGPVVKTLGKALGTGPALATWTTDLGPKVPSAGPQRGNEINTDTGGPWTPEQLKTYNQLHGTED
jgi:hypothetical protein